MNAPDLWTGPETHPASAEPAGTAGFQPARATLPLTVTTLRFTLRALDPVRLPAFAGSTLRGAIGRALRTLTCLTGAPDCAGCPVFNRCAYAGVWLADSPAKGALDAAGTAPSAEPPGRPTPLDDRSNRDAHASPPYIVVPPMWTGHPTRLAPGDLFGFRLHLFDSSIRPELWEAAVRAAALNGFAEGRGRMTTTATIEPPARPLLDDSGPWRQTVRLHFVTPLHIKADRQRLDRFDPVAFTRRLTARVEHLLSRYGSGPSPFEPEALADLAASCPIVEQNIQPVSDHRVSDRQGRTIPITGFVGHATLADVPRPVRQLWRLAETLHAGKGAPMGLGHVRVTEVA